MSTHTLTTALALSALLGLGACSSDAQCKRQQAAPTETEAASQASSSTDKAATAASAAAQASQPGKLPPGPAALFATPNATRAKIYLGADGKIEKYAVFLPVERAPDWLQQLAASELGEGSNTEYEIEYYDATMKVHELSRKGKDGSFAEISVTEADKKVYYIARQIKAEALPAPIQKAAEGYTLERAVKKELAAGKVLYQIRASKDGESHRMVFDEKGNLTHHTQKLPTTLEIPRGS